MSRQVCPVSCVIVMNLIHFISYSDPSGISYFYSIEILSDHIRLESNSNRGINPVGWGKRIDFPINSSCYFPENVRVHISY